MSKNSDSISTNVALVRGNNASEALVNAFKHFDGIDKFVEENDLVFIKISFGRPLGYLAKVNYDTLGKLIDLCWEAGAKKIYVGDFAAEHIDSEVLTEIMGLSSFLESKGAIFTHFDNKELFPRKKITLQDKQIQIPTLILDADKIFILNQVNVHPLFTYTLSYLNMLTIVPNKYQKIQKHERPGKDYLHLDQYKQDLISHILEIAEIRTPTLVINDLFYTIEVAGPLIYKDSRCKRHNLLIMGSNPFIVDYITLQLMNMELTENKLLIEAQDHQFGINDIEKIKIFGNSISDVQFNFQKCVSKLEDIEVKNCGISPGRYCSGCFEKAYHLLNFMKSGMTKDLKYMGYFSFLIGDTPSEPNIENDIILFGDCAINSTKNRDFRNITIQKNQISTDQVMQKLKKSQRTSSKTTKTKIVKNKRILELSGCPPNLNLCLKKLIKYYGKNIIPNLNLLNQINKDFIDMEK